MTAFRNRVILGILVLVAMLAFSIASHAQGNNNNGAISVASCGAQSLSAGQRGPIYVDLTGKLCTNASGGSGSNAAASATGSAVPADADYQGINIGGTLRGQTGTNPSGSIYAADVNVAAISAAATGTQTAANSDSIVCATDTHCVVNVSVTTSGGATNYFVQPTASDNHANIKNGAATVYYIHAFNNSATVNYIRLYNAASGFNGCNSATNLVWQGQIPASTSVGGFMAPIPAQGMGGFSSGLSICVTSGYATNDTTNATASAMSINVGYN